ncbi:MAG: phage head closure protein [Pseudomonadota bacterium]
MSRVSLNRQLTLEGLDRVPDGAGGFSDSWVTLGTLWAAIQAGSGREAVEQDARTSEVAMRITVRAAPHGAPSRPKPKQRFREGDRVYLIQAVTEADPRGRFLACFAKEEVVA